jgi:hypothetical protein
MHLRAHAEVEAQRLHDLKGRRSREFDDVSCCEHAGVLLYDGGRGRIGYLIEIPLRAGPDVLPVLLEVRGGVRGCESIPRRFDDSTIRRCR